jgi:hypothetical protein
MTKNRVNGTQPGATWNTIFSAMAEFYLLKDTLVKTKFLYLSEVLSFY